MAMLKSNERRRLMASIFRVALHAWFVLSILGLSLGICCWALLDNNEQPLTERHGSVDAVHSQRTRNDLHLTLPGIDNAVKTQFQRKLKSFSPLRQFLRWRRPLPAVCNLHDDRFRRAALIQDTILSSSSADSSPTLKEELAKTLTNINAATSTEQIHSFEEWRALQLKLQQEQQQQAALLRETTSFIPPLLSDDDRLNVLIKHADAAASSQQQQDANGKVDQNGYKGHSSVQNGAASSSFRKSNNKFNYAASKCGARIRNRNAEAKNADAILNSNRDDYMVSPCEARKFFTVELCEPIQPHAFEMGSLEFFSSPPRVVRLRGSQYYPATEWIELGSFTLRDERSIQPFDIQTATPAVSPSLYVKFIRVDVEGVYRNEHFCPISMFRLYGVSFVDEYNSVIHQQQQSSDADNGVPVTTPERVHVIGEDAVDEDEIEHMRAVGKKGSKKSTLKGDTTNDGADLASDGLNVNGKHKKDFVENVKDAVISLVKHAADVVMPAKPPATTLTTPSTVVPSTVSEPSVLEAVVDHLPPSSSEKVQPFEKLMVPDLHILKETGNWSLPSCVKNLPLSTDLPFWSTERFWLIVRRQCSTRRTANARPVRLTDIRALTANGSVKKKATVFKRVKSFFEASLPLRLRSRADDVLITPGMPGESVFAPVGNQEEHQPSVRGQGDVGDIVKSLKAAPCRQDLESDNQPKSSAVDFPSASAIKSDASSSADSDRTPGHTKTHPTAETIGNIADVPVHAGTLPPLSFQSSDDAASKVALPVNVDATSDNAKQLIKPIDSNKKIDSHIKANSILPTPEETTLRMPGINERKVSGSDAADSIVPPVSQIPATPAIILPYVSKPPVLVPVAAVQPQQVAEPSILMLISNRLRTVEQNVSLTSTYLENLSRRYRKLTEDIQQKQNVTNEQLRVAEEQREMLEQWVTRLQNKFDNMEEDLERQRQLLQPFYKRNMSLQYVVLMFIGFSLFTIFLAVVLVQSTRTQFEGQLTHLQWQLAEMREQIVSLNAESAARRQSVPVRDAAVQQQQLNNNAANTGGANVNEQNFAGSIRTPPRPASAAASLIMDRNVDGNEPLPRWNDNATFHAEALAEKEAVSGGDDEITDHDGLVATSSTHQPVRLQQIENDSERVVPCEVGTQLDAVEPRHATEARRSKFSVENNAPIDAFMPGTAMRNASFAETSNQNHFVAR